MTFSVSATDSDLNIIEQCDVKHIMTNKSNNVRFEGLNINTLLLVLQLSVSTFETTLFYILGVMVFNATFNNILVISWRSDLLVEETGVLGENQHKKFNINSPTPSGNVNKLFIFT